MSSPQSSANDQSASKYSDEVPAKIVVERDGRVDVVVLIMPGVSEDLKIDVVGGTDFPSDLTGYDIVIHCGACMFNRRTVLSRVRQAKAQGVPITNYGIAILFSHLSIAYIM